MLIELAQKLIICPSITPQDAGTMSMIADLLTKQGFKVLQKEFGAQGIKNLYAYCGSKDADLCFAGHVDVVQAGPEESWSHPPFSAAIANDKLYGRGAVDMKGAIAAMLVALSDYVKSHPHGNCSILLTADEEGEAQFGTKAMLEWLAAEGYKLKYVIVGEPTSEQQLGDVVKIGRRGSINFGLEVKGMQGHVAYPYKCLNPNHLIVQVLQMLSTHQFDQGNDSFAPSCLQITSIDVGNNTKNIIPNAASAEFNIRFNNCRSAEQLIAAVQEIIASFLSIKQFSLTAKVSALPFITSDLNLAQQVSMIISDFGIKTTLSTSGGTSDARFFSQHALNVIELGLLSDTAHQINEHLKLEDLQKLCNIYHRCLMQFC